LSRRSVMHTWTAESADGVLINGRFWRTSRKD